MVNEFRTGYNYDNSDRRSNFKAGRGRRQSGHSRTRRAWPTAFGFPSFQFIGTARTVRSTSRTPRRNVDRTLKQNAFSISNNITWIKGGHSIKAGGLYTRNIGTDGFGIGVNNRGLYRFNGAQTGNAFARLPARPADRRAATSVTARGPLDGYSNDFAVFVQDDWKVNRALTVFLGLRYEVVGTWHEERRLLANFVLDDGGHHVVPSAEVAAKLPPGSIALDRTLLASEAGLPDTLLNADKNNFSPRVGFAWRLDESNKTVLRGGFGLFHPTGAAQGVRDLLARNPFRYTITYSGRRPAQRVLGRRAVHGSARRSATRASIPISRRPDIYQYNLTRRARAAGRHGPARQLPRLDDAQAAQRRGLQHAAGQHRAVHQRRATRTMRRGCRSRPTAPSWTSSDNRGEGQFDACSWSSSAGGRAASRSTPPTRWPHSDSNAPDTRQQHDRAGPVRSVRHREGPRARSERREAPARGERHLGHPGRPRPQARRRHGGAGPTPSSAAGPCRRSCRRAADRTSRRSSAATTRPTPWNTGKPLDGLGNFFCCAWRPDQIGDPNTGGSRDAFFDLTAYALPADGKLGNAKKGSLKGPGTWVANFGFYKDIVATSGGMRVQFSAIMDNAFNHPQFFPGLWERLRPARRLPGQRRSQQRDDGSAGGRHHSQRGRILPRTRHTTRLTRHVLAGHRPCRASPAIGHLGARFGLPRVLAGRRPRSHRSTHSQPASRSSRSNPRCAWSWSKSRTGNR